MEKYFNNKTKENYIRENNVLKSSGKSIKIINQIPRFVENDNYNDRFGFQWKKWSHIHLDSYTKIPKSENELKMLLGKSKNEQLKNLEILNDKYILEAGSGAGRFTEILLKYKTKVDSFDYSTACEANYKNNAPKDNLRIFQADILNMPLRDEIYDYVMCIHVMQHIPDPTQAIKELYRKLRPGGTLVFDQYRFKFFKSMPTPIGGAGNLYRLFFIYFLPKKYQSIFAIFLVNLLFPIHWFFRNSKIMQFIFFRIFPVRFYYPWLGLKSKKQYYEWAMVDTHDSLIDMYKIYGNKKKIIKILNDLGATNINIWNGGNGVVVNCKKPSR